MKEYVDGFMKNATTMVERAVRDTIQEQRKIITAIAIIAERATQDGEEPTDWSSALHDIIKETEKAP